MYGVIASKLDLMARYLGHLRAVVPATLAELEGNWERQKAIERALQVLVEIVVDIADRIIALSSGPPSATGAGSLERLEQLGVVANAERYRPMVRFRNLIVHRYEEVDLSILFGIITQHLDNFEEFGREVRSYLDRSG